MVSVELEWEPAKPEDKVIRYILYRTPVAANKNAVKLKGIKAFTQNKLKFRKKIAELPVTQTKYTDSGNFPVQSYEYRIRTLNSDGKLSESSEAFRVDPPANAIPSVTSKPTTKISGTEPDLPKSLVKVEFIEPASGSTVKLTKSAKLKVTGKITGSDSKYLNVLGVYDTLGNALGGIEGASIKTGEIFKANIDLDKLKLNNRTTGLEPGNYSIVYFAKENFTVASLPSKLEDNNPPDGILGLDFFNLTIFEEKEKKGPKSELKRQQANHNESLKNQLLIWQKDENLTGEEGKTVIFWHKKKTEEHMQIVAQNLAWFVENLLINHNLDQLPVHNDENQFNNQDKLYIQKELPRQVDVINLINDVWSGKLKDALSIPQVKQFMLSKTHIEVFSELKNLTYKIDKAIDSTNEFNSSSSAKPLSSSNYPVGSNVYSKVPNFAKLKQEIKDMLPRRGISKESYEKYAEILSKLEPSVLERQARMQEDPKSFSIEETQVLRRDATQVQELKKEMAKYRPK